MPLNFNCRNSLQNINCFFCLKKCKKSSSLSNSKNKLSFDLGHVFRFIDAFHETEINDRNDLGGKLLRLRNIKNPSVPVCEDCSKMTSDIMNVLDTTKLRLGYIIKDIYEVMADEELENEDFQSPIMKKVKIERDVEDHEMTLRADTMELIKKIVPPTPVVVLQKLQLPPPAVLPRNLAAATVKCEPEMETASYSDDDDDSPSSPLPDEDDASLTSSEDMNVDADIKVERKALPRKVLKISVKKTVTATSKPKSSSKVSCPLCRAQFTERSSLRPHMVQYHCEHLFPNHKLDTVTDSQFQKLLSELLFKDILISSEHGNGRCSYCKKELRCKGKTFKGHFVSNHYEELEKKIREIQTDPDLSATLDTINPHGRVCDCGMYIQNQESQTAHDKFHCKLKSVSGKSSFTSVPSNKEIVICNLCKKTVKRKYAHHHDDFCSAKKARDEPAGGEKKRGPKIKYSKSCPYCRYECEDHGRNALMKKHLVRVHPEHFFQQPEGVTRDVFQRMVADILLSDHIQKQEGNSVITSCSLCGLASKCVNISQNYISSKIHLISKHKKELQKKLLKIVPDPELMNRLKSCNPDGISCPCGMYLPNGKKTTKLHHEKFQCKLQVKKVKPPSSSVNIEKKKGEVVCSICKARFNPGDSKVRGAYFLRLHMLQFHCAHFFPNHKLDSITDSQFRKILAELLFKDLIEGKKACEFCDKEFSTSNSSARNVSLIKNHFVEKHYSHLEERLLRIQRDPDLTKMLG